ncbi:hypothetical protein ES703_56657 [subsurface metagenome]
MDTIYLMVSKVRQGGYIPVTTYLQEYCEDWSTARGYKRQAADIYIGRLGEVKKRFKMTGTSRLGYYYKSKANKDKDKELLDKIRAIATEFPCYGYRRVTAELRRKGITVNRKRVHRIMAQNGILCTIRRKYRTTTNFKHGLVKDPNLIKGFTPTRHDELWYSDITYIRLETCFAYLAAIIDGFSRKAVGYTLGLTLSSKLTIAVLLDAVRTRDTKDLIHIFFRKEWMP